MTESEDHAVTDPVALVLVDSGLPHLDRPFEYAVPAALAPAAQPGVRVKVRFAGRDVAGYVIERRVTADHDGTLAPLRTVVSPEPVLTPAILELAREVAAAYAGTVGDVLRLAIPPRHARAEAALAGTATAEPLAEAAPESAWAAYAAGPALLRRLRDRAAPVAVWSAIAAAGDPECDWPAAFAQAAAATLEGGRGSLLIVPDHRDLDRLETALTATLGAGRHVRLSAEQGPQARYTAWLKVLRGHVQVVAGTRAAIFAPVRDLGLVAVWDDGDDLHEEPRAPYPHVREVALLRGGLEGAGVIVGGYGRTVAAERLLAAGLARQVLATADRVRSAAPRILVAGDDREQERDAAAVSARLPTLAWRTAKDALTAGPVLVQVPRRGYLPALACLSCRTRARCADCQGPLGRREHGPPDCRWCGQPAPGWTCPTCGEHRLRSSVVGARRTAEELGRAFPGVPVRRSGAEEVLASVGAEPALIIATPGAEPVAEGGYAAALLLDAWALLDRTDLESGPEALRRWLAAAALVRPAAVGGAVVLCGVPAGLVLAPVESLVRWDPSWLARRELAERHRLRLPPEIAFAVASGPRDAVEEVLVDPRLPASVDRFGPLGDPARPDRFRAVLKVAPEERLPVARLLAEHRAGRSARKEPDPLGVRIGWGDPGAN